MRYIELHFFLHTKMYICKYSFEKIVTATQEKFKINYI